MIFPWLNAIQIFKLPITLLLMLSCLGIQVLLNDTLVESSAQLEEASRDKTFLQVRGRLYAAMIRGERREQLKNVVQDSVNGRASARELLGHLSLREVASESVNLSDIQDSTLVTWYKKHKQKLEYTQVMHPYREFGFRSGEHSWQSFLTYQFFHGSWSHLFVNMAMLLILGSYLEPTIGALWFLVVYILGGAIGAMVFNLIAPPAGIPMVGASASVMALLGALLVLRKKVRFMWIFPTAQMTGHVELPIAVLGAYLVTMDIAGIVSSLSWLGSGVAHSAHLGGVLGGVVIVALIQLIGRIRAMGFSSFAGSHLK